MTPVQQQVRELYECYCQQHPNTPYQLRDENWEGYARCMKGWIANVYRLRHVPRNESWSQKNAEVKAAVEELVRTLRQI